MKDLGDVDWDIEFGEDFQLYVLVGDCQEGQWGYQCGVIGCCGIWFVVVGWVVVFDCDCEFVDFFVFYQKVVWCLIMFVDQCLGFFGNCYVVVVFCLNSC